MTDWEKFLKRKQTNLGYRSKTGAFGEPTEFEKAAALEIERQNWANTRTSWAVPNSGGRGDPFNENSNKPYPYSWGISEKGKTPFTISAEYSSPAGHGVNIRMTQPRIKEAIEAYINTPMEIVGRYEGIDIDVYKWREVGIIKAFFNWIMGRKVRRKK